MAKTNDDLEALAASLTKPKGKAKPAPKAAKAQAAPAAKVDHSGADETGVPAFLKRTETPEQAAARKAAATTRRAVFPAAKKEHAADAANRAKIKDAVSFVATMFIGTGKFEKCKAATLADARMRAAELAAKIKNGRKPMIYAELPDGLQVLVPADYQPENQPTETTMAKQGKTKPAAKVKAEAAKPKAAKAAKANGHARIKGAAEAKRRGDHEQARIDAEAGKLPPMPKLTHKSYAKHAVAMAALARAGDLAGLKKYEPTFAQFAKEGEYCSFRTPLAHYRHNALIALAARK